MHNTIQDPTAQLEQLRRNSLIGSSDLKLPGKKVVPNREMVRTSAPLAEEVLAQSHVPTTGGIAQSVPGVQTSATVPFESTAAKPTFKEPDFGTDGTVEKVEDVLSPTESV
jgi:hypothetical protein